VVNNRYPPIRFQGPLEIAEKLHRFGQMMKDIPGEGKVKRGFRQACLRSFCRQEINVIQSFLFSPAPYEVQVLRLGIDGVNFPGLFLLARSRGLPAPYKKIFSLPATLKVLTPPAVFKQIKPELTAPKWVNGFG